MSELNKVPEIFTFKLKRSDLPASCPPRSEDCWDLHPRVYIKLNQSGCGCCPYCGNQFVLEDD